MTEYRRTAIRRLTVRRYRSLDQLDLNDLPEIIVLYGPNGAGKSNVLRAAQLLLRAAALPGTPPMKREEATSFSLPQADKKLDLRPDDFRFGDLPEIRISLSIDLGTKAREILLLSSARNLSRLDLEGVFQMDGTDTIRFWLERAEIDGGVSMGTPSDPSKRDTRHNLESVRSRQSQLKVQLDQYEVALARIPAQPGSSAVIAERDSNEANARAVSQQLRQADEQLRRLETALGEDLLIAERVRSTLIPHLLHPSAAYRVPGGTEDPQTALYQAFLSEDARERDAAHRLGQRIAHAGLFGAPADGVALIPVDSRTYSEKQIRFRHPTHGELPLRNLGSGEQQVVLMLGQRVVTPYPIAHLEEPEAHLHKTLMDPLARVLSESVLGEGGTPDVDQLWMATHHHLFAISEQFFDVWLDEKGATHVDRRPRDEAVKHFYEPHPYWDTLRGLVASGMSDETIVSIDAQGQPIRARDVLASIKGDRQLANAFVEAATRAFVLSLTPDEPSA